ncbi:hypothetical protein PBY51_024354 [Eleginops maclovinus]|uniref:SMB domain-containing protein n=1 Tax=Eleginops maclovinus TaxID=56733 RepID=A0AAN8AVV9_ELEMC|nr:hypothetical protein PBY51_024354 [Eleginops maclovinus]
MSSTVLCAVTLLACALTFSAAQTSCKGLCGNEYNRGNMCQCDYGCLEYGECCRDYASQCTTKTSCKGRCGEGFKRGRHCNCDSDCAKFNQCCPDHKMHCDAEEAISGAASIPAPMKTNSCNSINDNKPKEPTLTEATDISKFSEENHAEDSSLPLVSPSSYPQDDFGDDMYSQVFPNDEFSNNGAEDPEAGPVPQSTSGYELSAADLLDQISTEPTQDPDRLQLSTETFTATSETQTTLPDSESTQFDVSPSTLYPTESIDARDVSSSSTTGTALPQPTTAAAVSSHPPPTTAPQSDFSPTANTQHLQAGGQAEVDILLGEMTLAYSDDLEVTTLSTSPHTPVDSRSTGPTQGSSTVLEDSQGTTISSLALDLTPITEATASDPGPADAESSTDSVTTAPTSSVSPKGPGDLPDLDALTTQTPLFTDALQDDTTKDHTSGVTTVDLPNVTPDPTKNTPFEVTATPQDKPAPNTPSQTKPTSPKPGSNSETKPLIPTQTLSIDNPKDYQADDSNDTNLCNGRPVGAVTTLRNGTMVVFRGHYFWLLDRHMVPSPAQSITQMWGVPSPIDTVFTRCNCQGKTYIFKGPQYWRFENVPEEERVSLLLQKRGNCAEIFLPFWHQSTCGKKVHNAVYTGGSRMVRQAVSLLGPSINIRTSWKGFPSTITAAVSVPSRTEPEGYKYYVFSRSTSYNVKTGGERPVVAAPTANKSPKSTDPFKCQKKV